LLLLLLSLLLLLLPLLLPLSLPFLLVIPEGDLLLKLFLLVILSEAKNPCIFRCPQKNPKILQNPQPQKSAIPQTVFPTQSTTP
jgi:hypothetical protein